MARPPQRRPVKRSPNEFLAHIDTRRREMILEAEACADSLGLAPDNYRDLLNAIVLEECVQRTSGNVERARMVHEWEMGAIRQDQTWGALEQLITILWDIGDIYLADPSNYVEGLV